VLYPVDLMDETARHLALSMIAAYSPYVAGRLTELSIEPASSLDEAVAEGEAWLRANLEELLARPFDRQRRGPLEVFQEAMRFPTDVLVAIGVPAVPRDPGSKAALPGDVYDLAPASSRQLGDEVWVAHLAWGATKARSFQGSPQVGLLSVNLMDRSRVEPLVERSGARLSVWAGFEGVPDGAKPDLALVDLTAPGALVAIEALVRTGVRVIAFGPHVDREAPRRARKVGAEQVLARSVFFERLGELLG
jgi:hypothetical protein